MNNTEKTFTILRDGERAEVTLSDAQAMYEAHIEGNGAATIGEEFGYTLHQADIIIDAYREEVA